MLWKRQFLSIKYMRVSISHCRSKLLRKVFTSWICCILDAKGDVFGAKLEENKMRNIVISWFDLFKQKKILRERVIKSTDILSKIKKKRAINILRWFSSRKINERIAVDFRTSSIILHSFSDWQYFNEISRELR